jgi:uncharacterized membrane protein YdbT with pleckstrin-like domain
MHITFPTQRSSPFQDRYPLSRKKWWKKMVDKVVPLFVISFILTVAASFVLALNLEKGDLGKAVLLDLVLGFPVFYLLLLVCSGFYYRAYIRSYSYDCGEEFVTIKKGVFAPREIHVQYRKIQDVYVDQDILDRILGIYDVHLASATAASGVEAHIDGVDFAAAEGIKNFLLAKVSGTEVAPVSEQAPSAMPAPVAMKAHVSSDEFPIAKAFYVNLTLGSLFSSGVWTLFLFWFFFRTGTSATLLSVIYVLMLVAHILGNYLWVKRFRFEFLPDYIKTVSGVLSVSEKHVPYRAIQDVVLHQGILSRMLGICNVRIENAAVGAPSGRRGTAYRGIVIPGLTIKHGTRLVAIVNEITSGMRGSSPTGV